MPTLSPVYRLVHAGPVTGAMNRELKDALRAFQQDKGLPLTGKLDDETASELRKDHRLS